MHRRLVKIAQRLLYGGGFFVLFSSLLLQAAFAATSRSNYFDYGPYYRDYQQVLGITLSSLEQLPAPQIPQNAQIPKEEGVLPGSPFHPFETFIENVQLTFTTDPVKKEELRLRIAAERLSEAKTLIDEGKHDLASDAMSNYQTAMATISRNMEKLAQQKAPGAETLAEKVEDTAAAHSIAAQSLALSSPPVVSENWNKVVDSTEKAMDAAADASSKPPIPDDLSESLQQLKEQGLITKEESNKLYGFDSRAKVREELDKLTASGQFPMSEVIKLDDAVASQFPEPYKETVGVMQFVELRLYQTLPPPPNETLTKIKDWQEAEGNVPPPDEIRPYLYFLRAEELAKEINLNKFENTQQAEIANFHPQAVLENPTYVIPTSAPTTSPSPTPSPTTSPTNDASSGQSASPSAGSAQEPTPTPFPTPIPPSADPYLIAYQGPLPGEPAYFFKQFGEGISLATTFDGSRKVELNMRFAQERLREASALAKDPKKDKQYEEALKKYKEAIKNASDQVEKFAGDEEKKKSLAESMEFEAARHNIIFEKGLLPMPQAETKIHSEIIEATENAMDKSADILERPALPIAVANRLQDLKAQGLILPEEVDTLTKANSREEVRKKIRDLTEEGIFPPADAKKMDEAQNLTSPSDYNQLIEVRKVEELQRLRATQSEFAQTATLRVTNQSYEQRINTLLQTIDPTLIKPEDLPGQDKLITALRAIEATASSRPINNGQFGQAATPGAQLASNNAPSRRDAVLTTCPIGAVFKQFEGCVWEENGRKINDYDQYQCGRSKEYWSFIAKACVPYDEDVTSRQDTGPICPVGYTWSWQNQSCQTSTGGILPFPTPIVEPTPSTDKELEKRSKSCPTGSTYKVPEGCVWDKDGESVYNPRKYRCNTGGSYYSFEQEKCVPAPKEGEPFPKDAYPDCKEGNNTWSWPEGKCIPVPQPIPPFAAVADINAPQPSFVMPDSPFYFLKQTAEAIQTATAITPKAREEVRLAHAKERFAEAYKMLEKKDEEGFKKRLALYTENMQQIYNDVSKGVNLNSTDSKAFGEKLADQAAEQNILLQKASVLGSKDIETPINAAVSMTVQGIDRASDLRGDPPIPSDIKEKIEALPKDMISEEEKKKLLAIDSRIEARVKLGALVNIGGLSQTDTAVFDKEIVKDDEASLEVINEIKKLDELVELSELKKTTEEKVEKTEDIAQKLDDFQKTYKVGEEVPSEVRPYVRLTRIDEIAQTIRPDIVRLEDFGNRKDIQLAVATLKEEFKPTKEIMKQLEDFRRTNPGKPLPLELARVEALAFGLGVRETAAPCFLPSPPFSPNTPCPPPGAAIPITSYYNAPPSLFPNIGGSNATPATPSTDAAGKPLVYGQGPKAVDTGVCPDGFHWMYDNGGWCMSNSGNYSSSYATASYGGGSTGQGYTPYTPYYNTPGVPPASYGYQGQGAYSVFTTSGSPYPYSPPSYYGVAPTGYTTNPPPGTVPGTGPAPTAPGQCPSGFHWMPPSPNQAGWCMSDGPTYVPSGVPYAYTSTGGTTSSTPPPGGYNCGGQPYDPVTKRCKDGACPGGFNWDGSKCVTNPYSPNLNQSSCGPGYYWDGRGCIPTNNPYSGGGSTPWCWSASPPPGGWGLSCGSGSSWDASTCSCRPSGSVNYPNSGGYTPGSSYQYGCTPGYYWDGSKCIAGSNEGSGWSDTAARNQSWCQPPSGGCGSNSYWDYGSCYCRSSNTYGGGGPSPSNQCQGLSCGGGAWLDYSTCSCRYSGTSSTGTSSTGSPITCYPPSQGCSGGWYDYSSCSCKQASSQGCSNVSASSCGSGWYFDSAACTCRQSSTSSGTSSGSCPSGSHWMSDNGGYCMSDSSSTSSSGSTSTSGSCPSGYHWMSDNGGWCMADGGGSTSTTTQTSGGTTTTTSPSPEPTPVPSTSTQSSPEPTPPPTQPTSTP